MMVRLDFGGRARSAARSLRVGLAPADGVALLAEPGPRLPFRDHAVDEIFMGNMIAWRSDIAEALDELWRVSKPGALIHLTLPGPRAATRVALAVFTLSLIAYLFCQRAELLFGLPRPLALLTLALCVSSTTWLWLAARGLFDDRFAFTPPVFGAAVGMLMLGLESDWSFFAL